MAQRSSLLRALSSRSLSAATSGASAEHVVPIVANALKHADRQAIVNRDGSSCEYKDLLQQSEGLAAKLQQHLGTSDLKGKRIGVLATPGSDYVAAQWAVWRAGGCHVPLCVTHPKPELDYVVEDCGVSAVISDTNFIDTAASLGVPYLSASDGSDGLMPPKYTPEGPAMIIYTSGTTGRPKGVVTRHSALEAQISDQVTEWKWTQDDRVLNCLPLHHVHGLVNGTCVPLSCGAAIEYIEPKPDRLWKRFRLGDMAGPGLSVFMAVPTIYSKLIENFDQMPKDVQDASSQAVGDLRVMISGSAALPTTIMEKWKQITGHTLLERYGMTEFAMGLTNPLEPVEARQPGFVGVPFPSIKVKIVDEKTREVVDPASGKSGELLITGPGVFKEYWNKPEATAKEFDDEGWFKTGDVAAFDPQLQSYQILGRASADIIKSAGYKISGLEIERVLLEHPGLAEIAVLGVPNEEYGEIVAAVVVMRNGYKFDPSELKKFAQERLAKYKIPTSFKELASEIPKNAMGKVSKKQLKQD
eukprot:CAMPEP_0184548394 /NCGR_PEP_ID=MMETSP0199_2-20130426/6178_1 /TAXON_ID=1112570 /ORGANISM="Thraustochytrium sp., Strain LLF1b" /LENGTH=528 /DNA_ID=CAMNT_0026943005 /DNA_START=10 /DNA_END=1593 /DNA_ORIENTATION=+